MGKHAMLSPSGAHRWMQCPGSVAMEQGEPDTSSEYADEGTAAHFLASECFNNNADPVTYFKRLIFVDPDGGADWNQGDHTEGRTFSVDEEMVAAVRRYIQTVEELRGEGELFVEQALPIGQLTGEEGAEGTGDAVIIRGDEIIVVDLKYGRGVEVYADSNEQLMLYALGALEKFEPFGPFKFARLVIVQPRIKHLSEWMTPVDELAKFTVKVSERAFHAMQVVKNENPEAYVHHLRPEEDACRFCKAKAKCPALARKVQEEVGAEFDVIANPAPDEHPGQLTAAMPDTDLSTKMSAVGLIEDWCKAVRAEVERRLLAGTPVPGYKLVQGRKGARSWANPLTAEETLKSMRLKVEEMYDLSLISPTTAEKLAQEGKLGPKQWTKLGGLIVQKDGKPSVAPESDKRPALEIKPVIDEFDVIAPAEEVSDAPC